MTRYPMLIATNTRTHQIYRFRKLDALVRRLGGDDYKLEHADTTQPSSRVVSVLHWRPGTRSASIVCQLRISAEDWALVASDHEFGTRYAL